MKEFPRLTAEQAAYLTANYATASMQELMQELGRPELSVQLAANSRGLKRRISFEVERTLDCIAQNPGIRRAQIAAKLGKGLVAVGRTLNVLNNMKLARAVGRGRATQWHAIPDAEPVPLPKRKPTQDPVQSSPSRWAGVASIFGATV